jgi:DNA-binding NtrC family response regulator
MAAADNDRRTSPLVYTEAGGALVARRWKIEVTEGPDAGRALVRDAGSVVVGSHADADLALTDDAVSRYHLELKLLAEGVLVVDLGSTNGTKVGGVRVERALVQAGGTVRLGRTILKVSPNDDRIDVDDDESGKFGDFVTRSQGLARVLARLVIVAQTDASVLIEGEPGTGKELLARALHESSPRAQGTFVILDCRAASEEHLLAVLEAASRGTIFLDELGDLPLELQPKLLRVIESRSTKKAEARFVASSTRDLEKLVRDKTFRDDLFYRIAVVRAKITPLRERAEDIPVLAGLFAQKIGGMAAQVSGEVVGVLSSYDWPGNARELRNVIERAVALSQGGTIRPGDLFPEDAARDRASFHDAKDQVIAEFEKRYVRALMARHNGNVSGAAREAGLSRTALYALMKRAGMPVREGDG